MTNEALDLEAKSNFELWMITLTVMLVAVIEVLDMTIVNVALTPMMGSLGASSDQITWVLTSYIVSSAIFMLLTGVLVDRLGQKKLLLINIIGFLLSSMLCGIATGLPEMVLFRTLQGIFGASLVPLSQLILRTTYKPSDIGKAMAIWGVGIMVAPVLGPTLGGYITDNLNWRWVFYINFPVCIIAFFMALTFIRDTPIRKHATDWFGMLLMAIGVGCLQIFLDRGNSESWFQSHSITALAIISAITLTYFIHRGLKISNNIINLRIFADKNFFICCTILLVYAGVMLGLLSIQPILLENVLGYTSEITGLVMAPRGIASAVSMAIASVLMKKFDIRKIMFFGILLSIIGTYDMCYYNPFTEQRYWMFSAALQGFGMGLFFVPTSTLCFSTLQAHDIPAASGLFSFCRNIGISIGISLFSTVVSRESQANWNRLGSSIQPFNENLTHWLASHGWTIHSPMALSQLQTMLTNQSMMIAFLNTFWLSFWLLIAMLPMVFLLDKTKLSDKKQVVPH